jgi:hypothetical protein
MNMFVEVYACLLIVGILAGQEQRHDLYGPILQSIGDNRDRWQEILAAHANFRIKVNMRLLSFDHIH